VVISNIDHKKTVAVALHIDGLPAEPPDIHCRAAAAPFAALRSVQPAAIPANSAVVCSLAVTRAKGGEDAVLTAVDQNGRVLEELQLESGLARTGKQDLHKRPTMLGMCSCCNIEGRLRAASLKEGLCSDTVVRAARGPQDSMQSGNHVHGRLRSTMHVTYLICCWHAKYA
jgi:hypothetical protein